MPPANAEGGVPPRRRGPDAETRPMAQAKSTEELGPGEWMELEGRELLRRLAVGNIANFTGRLDYIAGRKPLGVKLEAKTDAFCDNFLLRVAVPTDRRSESGPRRRRAAAGRPRRVGERAYR